MQSVVAKLTARLETIQTCGSKNSRVFEGYKCVMAEMAACTKVCKTGTAKLALGRSGVVAKIAACSKDAKCACKNSSLLEIVWQQNWLLDRGM